MKKLILALIVPINTTLTVTIHEAVKEDNYKAVNALLDEGSSQVNAQDILKRTPLHIVAQHGTEGMADLLLCKGAKTNSLNQEDWTPLHTAIWYNNIPVAKILIQHGADINASDPKYGNTPLHKAMQRCDLERVSFLIEYGANMDIKNARGEAPVDVITREDNSGVVSFLKDFSKKLTHFIENPLQSLSDTMVLSHIYYALLDKQYQEYVLDIGKKYIISSEYASFSNLFTDFYDNDPSTQRSQRRKISYGIMQQLNLMVMRNNGKLTNLTYSFE